MHKIILYFLVFVFGCGTLVAQEKPDVKNYKIGISGGVSLFFENDLKKLNSEVLSSSSLGAEMLDNFPPYFCYGGYILNQWGKKFAIGPSYNFYTTGSRLGVKDYSGSYYFDQIISSHSPGIQIEFLVSEHARYNVYFETVAGAHFSSWKYKEELKVWDENSTDKQVFRAVKPFVYPGFKFLWPIYYEFRVALKGGYSVDLGGKFRDGNATANTKVLFSGPRLTAVVEYGF